MKKGWIKWWLRTLCFQCPTQKIGYPEYSTVVKNSMGVWRRPPFSLKTKTSRETENSLGGWLTTSS
jgi:hypothetical protein